RSDFISAINQVSNEKGVSKDVIIQAIEAALVSAYKRDFAGAQNQDVVVRIDRQNGGVKVFVLKQVVDDLTDSKTQMTLDEGKAEASMPTTEQICSETYRPGQRLKVLMVEVNRTPKGPQIIVSRTHRNLVRRLLELEVPEIFSGAVEIKSIAREPGIRSKVAV